MTRLLVQAGATLLAAIASAAAAETPAAVEHDLAAAGRRWDADAAVAVLTRARTLRRAFPTPGTALLQVRAGLLAAELLRVRYEEAAPATAGRETLGRRIDAFAGEALALLPALPESSERWRMEADLVATMIRSDFRATKYEARLRAAIAKARALDPANPRAIVSEAKPLLFAPPGHGRDYHAGIALLDRALALEPRLEAALLLRAFARDGLGERAAAEADWRAALALNPDCEPARRALAGPIPAGARE
jgi:tetratricopeptide (TPR) repeat protein